MSTVRTEMYEAAYGKLPRGRGTWFFSVEREPKYDNVEITKAFRGLYTEARKKAVAHFGRKATIWVVP